MTTMVDPQEGHLSEHLSEHLPEAGREPVLLHAIPPRLVHRVHHQDVFVTDVRVLRYNTFQVTVRWPGTHCFYGPVTPGLHDPLMFLESVRQAGLLVAHVAFGIPVNHKFIVHEKRFGVSAAGLRTDGTRPVDVQLIVAAHDIRRRGRGFAGMRFEFSCLRDGLPVAAAEYRWSCVSAAGYDRLRGGYRAAVPPSRDGFDLVAPHRVGRTGEIDVMLAGSAGEGTWAVRIDPGHPVVYDHHFDHVPGNGAIEAARQAALLAAGRPTALPVGGDFAFHHYIEFDKPCRVRAECADTSRDLTAVRIRFEQDGRTAAEGNFNLLLRG